MDTAIYRYICTNPTYIPNPMLHVFADRHIYELEHFLPEAVNLTLYDPQKPLSVPAGTDAMLIRTSRTINADSLGPLPSSLQFVGTASAGTDHVDIPWLTGQDITFTNAAGCNARAVGEYVTTALLLWAHRRKINLQKLTVGIIGVGHTGGEVRRLLNKLGMQTALYDPPRAEKDSTFNSASRSELLNCDVLTFHTPLTADSKYETYHWLNEDKLAGRTFKLIINASRGSVVDEDALFTAYQADQIDDYIFDVWESEPVFSNHIARQAFIHTPHIAGYSIQAKRNATRMVTEPLCDYFNLEKPTIDWGNSEPPVSVPPNITSLPELLWFLHPIDDYHQKFAAFINEPSKKKGNKFSQLRTEHPLREEYWSISFKKNIKNDFPKFAGIFRNGNN